MNLKKLLKPLYGLFLLGLPLVSQGQMDTLVIRDFKMTPEQAHTLPFMSDTTDLNGQYYDPMSQLQLLPQLDIDSPLLTPLSVTSEEGYLIASGAAGSMHTLYTSFLSTRYELAQILLESNSPYILYLDGRELGRSDMYKGDAELEPRSFRVEFEPSSTHTLVIRLAMAFEGDTKIRVRLVPDRENAEIENRIDGKEYLSLRYMQSGENIYSISVSPSGKYVRLMTRDQINNQNTYRAVVYENGRPKTELGEDFRFAQWMPQSDKLYTTEKTNGGQRLVTFDPSTLKKEVLAESIPEGTFYFTPTEEQLIYLPQVKGPEKGGLATRYLERYDRMESFRNRDFLALFDFATGEHRSLTFGHRGTALHDISKDGKELIISSSYNTTEIPFSESDYMALNIETMVADTLFAADSDISRVYYTSKPEYLLVVGNANAFEGIGRNLQEGMVVNTYDNQLFLYNRTTQVAEPLTKDFSPNVSDVQVLPNSFSVVFTAEDEDRISLYQCDLEKRKITQIPTSEEVLRNFGVDNNGRTVAYTGQSIMNPDRAYQIDLRRNRETLLYDLAPSKMENLMLGEAHDWDFTMPNGDRVQGRYYLPPNFDPNEKYPMIVYYYGGTAPTYRVFEGSYSLPMYAAQGYVVYTLNPSGTTGFGQEYAARHINAWGKRTAEEIVESVKGFCEAHPFVNREKIGCMGASYGGFMTQYLQTITDIFAAAVSHAGISALSSYWGEGYWGIGYSTVASHGSYPWNNPELYTQQSPLFNADKITTPLLLLHGDSDTNVPDGESIQMFNAMKILGKEVEYVSFHGENHGISNPESKTLWTNTIFAWFQKWLKDDSAWWDRLYPPVQL